ncbi:MAG: site-specific DNA-methyltransferase [Candidatus Vecturithrix sp.]|nr:site-specific DNA-methyltransferase [Candidatus Vecturithrix sp.]
MTQLVWQGKDEQDRADLEVPVVPIYIQEKIHPHAIIEDIRRQAKQAAQQQGETTLDLFADFNGIDFEQQLEFYQHNQKWQNRMILGDSLFVMTSLAEKEGLKGQVQMIYLDPPYGIKFGSNWQVSTRKRDVKDGKAEDLTRQPEQVKAFRDTWKLGIHSYLAYLRDRLAAARELLTDSGSVFVQIGDENVHLVRCLLDEVFGSENFVSQIAFSTTTGRGASYLDAVYDIILWYGKNYENLKYRPLFLERTKSMLDARYRYIQLQNGSERTLSKEELEKPELISEGSRFRKSGLSSQGVTQGETSEPFIWRGKIYSPSSGRHWSTDHQGLKNLNCANRITIEGKSLVYKRFDEDYPLIPMRNMWTDTGGGALVTEKIYVVQTVTKVIERCILISTDPGDLVLDPTCVRKGTRVFTPPAPPQAQGC